MAVGAVAIAGLVLAGAQTLETYRQQRIQSNLAQFQATTTRLGAEKGLANLPEQQELATRGLGRGVEGLEVGFETEKGLQAAQEQVSGFQRSQQQFEEAVRGGKLTLARGIATKEARELSATTAFVNASMGPSAFRSAFTQMSVNQNATFAQQEIGLRKEAAFSRGAYAEQLKVFALQTARRDAMFDIEMRGAKDARRRLAMDFEERNAELRGIIADADAAKNAADKASDILGIGDEVSDVVETVKSWF